MRNVCLYLVNKGKNSRQKKQRAAFFFFRRERICIFILFMYLLIYLFLLEGRSKLSDRKNHWLLERKNYINMSQKVKIVNYHSFFLRLFPQERLIIWKLGVILNMIIKMIVIMEVMMIMIFVVTVMEIKLLNLMKLVMIMIMQIVKIAVVIMIW